MKRNTCSLRKTIIKAVLKEKLASGAELSRFGAAFQERRPWDSWVKGLMAQCSWSCSVPHSERTADGLRA